jgi:hypothetical protein
MPGSPSKGFLLGCAFLQTIGLRECLGDNTVKSACSNLMRKLLGLA